MRLKPFLDLFVTAAIGVAAVSVTWHSWTEPKAAVRSQGQPPPVFEDISSSGLRTSIDGAPRSGTDASPVVLIEYSDFECPFCARHASETFELIRTEFIAKGGLQYVFRNYPIEQIHPFAIKAAHAGRCAHEQGLFVEMRTQLFANQKALGQLDLTTMATSLGLDGGRFDACMAAAEASDFRAEKQEAARLGVSSTPVFLLGRRDTNGEIRLRIRIAGAQPYARFKEQIERLISAGTSSASES